MQNKKTLNSLIIRRYCDFSQLYYILEKELLPLSAVSLFDDIFEGELPTEYFKNFLKKYKNDYEITNHIIKNILHPCLKTSLCNQQFRERAYISCWHQNDSESIDMWERYASINKGVCIISNFGKLKALLPKEKNMCDLKPVTYIAEQGPFPKEIDIWSRFFLKRIAFKSENEIRAIVWAEEGAKNYFLPIKNITDFIQKVIISPKSSQSFFESVQMLCQSKKIPVERSILSPVYANDADKVYDCIKKAAPKNGKKNCEICNGRGYFYKFKVIRLCKCINMSKFYKKLLRYLICFK